MMYKYVLLYFLFIGFSQSLISQSATETGFFQQLSVTATLSNRAQGLLVPAVRCTAISASLVV
jgi:hypothetical protein